MSNSLETFRYEDPDGDSGGVFTFDWSNGNTSVVWDNGFSESWPNRGYDILSKAASYLMQTNQMDRYEEVMRQTGLKGYE